MQEKQIQIDNLSFSYGNKKVLNNFFLNIYQGTIVSILGANGAGKTTLFNCLTKNLKVPNGKILYEGVDINKLSFKDLSKTVSFVSQLNSFNESDCSVRDYLVEGRAPYIKAFSTPTMVDYLLVEKHASRMGIENILNSNLMHLSGGQLQIVAITRALIQETPIIIMDEPMSALDLGNQVIILRLIKELSTQGKTIIFTTHNPNHAIALNCEACVIDGGMLVGCGEAKKTLTLDVIRKIYGDSFGISNNEYIEIKI